MLPRGFRKLWMPGDSGSDRSGSQVDLPQALHRLFKARVILGQGDREGLELLLQGHGHGILKLCAADLYDPGELAAFVVKCFLQKLKLGKKSLDGETQADLERCRISVIRALATIYMVIRIEVFVVAFGIPGQF